MPGIRKTLAGAHKKIVLFLLLALLIQPLAAQAIHAQFSDKNQRLHDRIEAYKRRQADLLATPGRKTARKSEGRNRTKQLSNPFSTPASTPPGADPKTPERSIVGSNAPVTAPTPTVAQTSSNLGVTQVDSDGYTLRPVDLNVHQWPLVRLDFSIERGDRTPFTALTAADVQASVDGKPVAVAPDDLNFKSSASSGVLLVIDLSRSMTGGGRGISKLAATKEAILSLIDSLAATDQVGVIAFDQSQRVVMEPTTDRQALKTSIRNLSVRGGGGTALYSAADFALRFAETNRLGNIILLSDGCEYSAESRQHSRTGTFARFKSEREQRIAEASCRAGIRVFSIAIGEQNPRSPLYVDTPSLANITKGTPGGFSSFIDLPALIGQSDGDNNRYSTLLTGSLKSALDRIRQSFRYDYSLTLREVAAASANGQPHKAIIHFRVGDVLLPMEFTYNLPGGSARPTVEMKVLTPVLIEAPAAGLSRWWLLRIFLSLLLALNLLALVPSGMEWAEAWHRRRCLHRAIVTLRGNSSLIGGTCPNEGNQLGGSRRFKAGDAVVICPECETAHHVGCWQLSKGRCWNRHCGHELNLAGISSAEAMA